MLRTNIVINNAEVKAWRLRKRENIVVCRWFWKVIGLFVNCYKLIDFDVRIVLTSPHNPLSTLERGKTIYVRRITKLPSTTYNH